MRFRKSSLLNDLIYSIYWHLKIENLMMMMMMMITMMTLTMITRIVFLRKNICLPFLGIKKIKNCI